MVNFKASSHAGAHKRALAGGEAEAVSKLDKLPQQGSAADATRGGLTLTVQLMDANARPIKTCLVSPAAYEGLLRSKDSAPGAVFVRRPGSDCVLTARASADVADGVIGLSDVQCRNLRVCAHEQYAWELFAPEEPVFELGALFLEAWLLDPPEADSTAIPAVDGFALCAQLGKELFGHVVSNAELFALSERSSGVRLVLRVTDVLPDASHAEEQAERAGAGAAGNDGNGDADSDGDAEELGGRIVEKHVWRGLVGANTVVLVSRLEPPLSQRALDGHRQPSTRFELSGCAQMLAHMHQLRSAPRRNEVRVHCSDGEWFNVHAALLKPCIALHGQVRKALREAAGSPAVGAGEAPSIAVDVDTLSLDKVLLHLEAGLRGHEAPLDVAAAEQLRPVGAKLGYRALTEHCDKVLGDFQTRLRVYSWAEVNEHNKRLGGCWIVMDGMVLDVERWLPEHPGGEHIIPQQVRTDGRLLRV